MKKLNMKRVIATAVVGGAILGSTLTMGIQAIVDAPKIQWEEVVVQPGDTPLSLVQGDKHYLPEFLEVNEVQPYKGQYLLHIGEEVLVPVKGGEEE